MNFHNSPVPVFGVGRCRSCGEVLKTSDFEEECEHCYYSYCQVCLIPIDFWDSDDRNPCDGCRWGCAEENTTQEEHNSILMERELAYHGDPRTTLFWKDGKRPMMVANSERRELYQIRSEYITPEALRVVKNLLPSVRDVTFWTELGSQTLLTERDLHRVE